METLMEHSPELLALKKAIEVLGGQSEAAKKITNLLANSDITIKQQNISSWINRSKRTPERFAYSIERLTSIAGSTVYAHELCPISFPNLGDR